MKERTDVFPCAGRHPQEKRKRHRHRAFFRRRGRFFFLLLADVVFVVFFPRQGNVLEIGLSFLHESGRGQGRGRELSDRPRKFCVVFEPGDEI